MFVLAASAAAFRTAVAPTSRSVSLNGAKTDFIRRIPLLGRLAPKKRTTHLSPAIAPPPDTALDGQPDIVARLDDVAEESSALLDAVVESMVNTGLAVPFEAPSKEAPPPPPAPADPLVEFDRMHAAGEVEELLAQLRDASRDSGLVDAEVEWRLARACLDSSDALPEADTKREGLVREGLEAARRAAALAPEDGAAQKWLGIMLGSVGDFEPTKEKIKNSYAIKEALDAAYRLRPDDATVALALGQWCLKVASVSFVERGLARAIFGTPPESSFAEALKYFKKAQELKPQTKTKALIKLVEGKMRGK